MSRTDGPVEVGFFGGGSVLWAYLQLLDRLVARGRAREGAIWVRRREAWPEIRRRRPGVHLVATAREVLESDAGLVVVLTPPSTHAELALLGLRHAKHVLVEKPIAASRADAQHVVDAADAAGLMLVAAPFVHLAPTFRALWTRVRNGSIGHVHSARGLYGNAGSTWSSWYHTAGVGPLGDLAIYNLKSLTALLGPVRSVQADELTAVTPRRIGTAWIAAPDPDVVHLLARHESGAISVVSASHAIQRYRRPALELYGTTGTANLLGDDWNPTGFEIWRNSASAWEQSEAVDATWLWTDGLREAIDSLHEGRAPLQDLEQDLHLLDVLAATRQALQRGSSVALGSTFRGADLTLEPERKAQHLHDPTRASDEQA